MHCAKDLTVFRPLAIQMKLLRDEIIQLKSEVKLQAQKFDNLVEEGRNRSGNNVEEIRSDSELSEDGALLSQPSFLTLFNLVALTLLVIGLSHWMLLFVYDAPLSNSEFGPFCGLPCLVISWPNKLEDACFSNF